DDARADIRMVREEAIDACGDERLQLTREVLLFWQEVLIATEGPWMQTEAGGVSVFDKACRRGETVVRVTRNDQRFVRSDGVGVLRDVVQTCGADQLCVGAAFAEGAAFGLYELHHRKVRFLSEPNEIFRLEGLDEDFRVRALVAEARERLEQRPIHREVDVI